MKIKYIVAVGIGLLFGWFQLRFWAVYPINNPITNLLLDTFAKQGQSELFYFFTYVHDFVVHLLLALVLALVLVRLFGPRKWALILAVVAAWHVAVFWDIEWAGIPLLIQHWGFWINLATTLSVIPAAYVIAARIRQNPSPS